MANFNNFNMKAQNTTWRRWVHTNGDKHLQPHSVVLKGGISGKDQTHSSGSRVALVPTTEIHRATGLFAVFNLTSGLTSPFRSVSSPFLGVTLPELVSLEVLLMSVE